MYISFGGVCFILAAVALNGCGKKEPRPEYVARVNNSYLTSDEFASLTDTSKSNKYYSEEIIRKWIDRELLYQKAVQEGITEENYFKEKIRDSEKELAASILINNYYENEDVEISQDEIEKYYIKNRAEFMINLPAYLVNIISFNDEEKAIKFRNTVVETEWDKASDLFEGDSSISRKNENKFLYEYEIHPNSLLRIVKELYPMEISIILNDQKENHIMIQLLEKYNRGTIPPLNVIKSSVEKRLLFQKKETLLRDYIKKLYSNNEIEVKN